MAWFQTPRERHTSFIQPAALPGGLLGGASESQPKMSKLQALAAARKKKAQEQKNNAAVEEVNKPLARLVISVPASQADGTAEGYRSDRTAPAQNTATSGTWREYSTLKRKSSSPHRKTSQPSDTPPAVYIEPDQETPPAPFVEQAAPSAFASTMFDNDSVHVPRKPASALFTLPYSRNTSVQSTDAFAGPSPDDVVIAAQSKGSAQSGKPKR